MTNIAILMGTLGKDVEVKQLPNGKDVANVSMATNENYKDKDWNKVDKTCWHNLTAFGNTAIFMGKYLSKWSKVLVEWKIDNGSYEKDWVKIYTSKVIVNRVNFAGCKPQQDEFAQSDDKHLNWVQKAKKEADALSVEDLPF